MTSRLCRLNAFRHESGHCYVCVLPSDLPLGDSADRPQRSGLELFENGRPLGPAHSLHDDIRATGRGRFSHWENKLYFSTRDNQDPRHNRREYCGYVPEPLANEREARIEALLRRTQEAASASEAYDVAEALFYEACPDAFLGESGKTCWNDDAFVADYQRLVPGNRRSFERKFAVAQLVAALRHLPGDLVECGVYNGATAYFMATAAARSGRPRALHLFDSFAGLSLPGSRDGNYWSVGAMAMPEATVKETLRGIDQVTLYPGWIPERFEEVEGRRFAFVHVDVDLYEPTLASMQFFYPRVVSGGMLVCDDYGFATCPGATEAIDEFMRDKPESIIHLPTGQGLVIRS